LPLAIIGSYLLLTGRLKIVLKPRLLLFGTLIFLAVASTWYWPVIARHGEEFIDEFFIAHHFQRYLSNKYKHPQPFYFFFLVAIAGSFPWSFFLISNAWTTLRELRTKFDWKKERLKLFLWLWVLIPIIFFSFSGSKLPGYILPVFPPIALLIGLELENWWAEKEPGRMKLLAVATVGLIFAVALVVGLRGDSEIGLDLFDSFTVATIAVIVGVVYLALWFLLNGRAATLFLPFGLAVVVVTAVNIIFPVLGNVESLRELSLIAKRVALPGERLVFYVNQDQGINYYATELPLRDERSELIVVASPEEVESLIMASGSTSILVASLKSWANGINETPHMTFEVLGEQKRNRDCSPECDWVLQRAQLK
jgi:4-amino-4-deoxy-L-arabinose transferase-like glycosyltransferase